ncbi:hypothetical protein NDU88_005795 [Pleurodeles waltl]|uniref:Uncharacterized protein n=1 Tax=Pleurodeles waltl TaxID=8319 RepID=A0AAV7MZ31_PLEWA|nr:hypothetical protein NDU88_005795 [Pleurodeles waltl]
MQVRPHRAPQSLPRHPRRRSRPAPRASVQPQDPTSGPAVPSSPGPSRRCDPSSADSARRSPAGPLAPLGCTTASRSWRPFTRGPDRSARLHTGGQFRQPQAQPWPDSPPCGAAPGSADSTPLSPPGPYLSGVPPGVGFPPALPLLVLQCPQTHRGSPRLPLRCESA